MLFNRLRAVSLFLVRGVHARASVERRSRETRETRYRLSRLAPTVTRVVICLSRAFCLTDQEKRETARSLAFQLVVFLSKSTLVTVINPFSNRVIDLLHKTIQCRIKLTRYFLPDLFSSRYSYQTSRGLELVNKLFKS